MVCDFCLGPNPVWDYPAKPAIGVAGLFGAWGGDGFAVCEECAALIEAEDWTPLLARVLKQQQINVPEGSLVDGGVVRYPSERVRSQNAAQNIAIFIATYEHTRTVLAPPSSS